MIVCEATGKDRYLRKSEVRAKATFSRNKGISVYKCPTCKGWHFGGVKPVDSRIKVRGRLHG